MQERERLGSRLGFILLSAGCAIGLGNVYRFPIWTGAYGGGVFLLFYLIFLILLGIPVMTTELSVGRASQRSIATSFDVLEKPGQKWHWMKALGVAGNYLLMMFYTTISGWFLIYFVKYLNGSIMEHTTAEALGNVFGSIVSNPGLNIPVTILVIVMCFGACAIGLQKGVEKITKVMMVLLLILILGLGIYACTLPGAGAGLKFYLVPSMATLKSHNIPLGTVISAAMSQAFFTLSLGIGSIAIFGSYIKKDRSLLGETFTIVGLDTFVALMSGLVIFPAYFTFNPGTTGVTADQAGAGFLFTTLSSIFNNMAGGRLIGTLFFMFMVFAAFSTVIAVFEKHHVVLAGMDEAEALAGGADQHRRIFRADAAVHLQQCRRLRAFKKDLPRAQFRRFRGFPRFEYRAAGGLADLRAVLHEPLWVGLEELLCRGQRRQGRENAEMGARLYVDSPAAHHSGDSGNVRAADEGCIDGGGGFAHYRGSARGEHRTDRSRINR